MSLWCVTNVFVCAGNNKRMSLSMAGWKSWHVVGTGRPGKVHARLISGGGPEERLVSKPFVRQRVTTHN